MVYFTYIVLCSDNTYYCGYTNDLEKRIYNHNTSKVGAKYTKSRRPVKLVYSEANETKTLAMKREYEIKQLNRKEKESLISSNKYDK